MNSAQIRRLERLEAGLPPAPFNGTIDDLCALPPPQIEQAVKRLSDEQLKAFIAECRARVQSEGAAS
jgi:hypothetical protein